MKILKVVVDELPKSCSDCPYPYGVQNEIDWFCGIMQTAAEEDEMGETDDYSANNYRDRPDWCPLRTQEQTLRDYASPLANWESED